MAQMMEWAFHQASRFAYMDAGTISNLLILMFFLLGIVLRPFFSDCLPGILEYVFIYSILNAS